MKKIFISFFLIVITLLNSCGEDTTQEAKDEFSKYFNEKNEVVLNIGGYLYFENFTINLSDLVKDNEFNNGLIVYKDKLFFSTSKENSKFNFTLNIYESNLQGTNIKTIYTKDGFNTHPWSYAYDGVFYVEHYSNNTFDLESKLIDKYTISTKTYENIDSGKNCNLSDYFVKEQNNEYTIEMKENLSPTKHGKFTVTKNDTGEVRIIDDEYLKNTIYIDSMNIYNYEPERFDISKGHILLTYSIAAGDGWNSSHLVFEYDFNNNLLEYKLLVFPYDRVGVDIIYIGE